MRLLPLLCVPFTSLLTGQDPDAARVDREAVLRHYATVEAELRRATPPADAEVAARRLEVIDHLREYRLRGDFGRNPGYAGSRVPLFIDAGGRRCAVAWLLDHTDHGWLTQDVHRRHNQAWVAELAGDERLAQWLGEYGITAAEAVRIQVPGSGTWGGPSQPPPPADRPPRQDTPDWRPTDAAPPSSSGSGTGGGGTPGSPSSAPAPVGGGTAAGTTPRGIPMLDMQANSWLDWWTWNRDTFERPQANSPAATGTTQAVGVPQQTAEHLLTDLARAPEPSLRAAAVQSLGRMGAAIDFASFLRDSSREVRLAALLALGSSGNAANAYQLLASGEDPMPGETRAVALAAAALLDDGAAKRSLAGDVVRELLNPDLSVRSAAALATAGQPAAERRAAAYAMLREAKNTRLRAEAAQLLGPGAEADDVATLTALASDRDVDVRRAAALALGRSRHELALPALQTAFELEHEAATQSAQLLAIGDHGGGAAGAFLLDALTNGKKPLRAYAALALGLWGRNRDTTAIADAIVDASRAEKNHDQQGAYLLALGILRHTPARDLLVTQLRDNQSSPVRGAAAISLGLLGDRFALAALRAAATTDSCPWVRTQAARAASQLGVAGLDLLIDVMCGDQEAAVQAAAAFALGGLHDERAAAALLARAADATVPAAARAGAALGLGRYYRCHDAQLPALRFQCNYRRLPAITAWAFAQEL